MMQRTLFCFILCFLKSFLLFSGDDNKYTIIGTLPDSIDNIYVYLAPVVLPGSPAFENNYIKQDSALVKKGRFVFNGIAGTGKDLYSIGSKNDRATMGMAIIEPGTIRYDYQKNNFNGGTALSRGTPLNDRFTDSIVIPSFELAGFGQAIMDGTVNFADPEMAESISKIRSQTMVLTKNIVSFINENINNRVGECIFLMYSLQLPEKEVNNILPNLSEDARQNYQGLKNLVALPPVSNNSQYIDFRGKTPDNNYLKLSDYIKQNKLILLDFWASWCTPCIKEMPVIAQLYEEYKDKGLEIIGVSLDENESSWTKAIEKNNMSWIQIISNKDGSDNIAGMYGVSLIPYTVLINSTGEIIASNLRGQELVEKIKEILE